MPAQPTLYIVATPIGTLADMSSRAKDTLARVDFVACEDTRRSKELLQALNLPHAPLVSLHEHNEIQKSERLVERLMKSPGQSAALVSDAGTPAISDPGAVFVDACHRAGVRIENIPGPSSLVAAIAASGFLQPRILFSGFLSRQAAEQIEEFKRWTQIAPCVAVCFESPNRVLTTLKNAAGFFPPETSICLSREISKKFEEHLRKSLAEHISALQGGELPRGECILTFEITKNHTEQITSMTFLECVEDILLFLKENPNVHLKEICKERAEKYSFNSKDLYNAVLQRRRE